MRKVLAAVAALFLVALPAWGQTESQEIEIIDINGGLHMD